MFYSDSRLILEVDYGPTIDQAFICFLVPILVAAGNNETHPAELVSRLKADGVGFSICKVGRNKPVDLIDEIRQFLQSYNSQTT